MKSLLAVPVLITALLISNFSLAALAIRDLDGDWSNGHEGVYDDVLNITWLADAVMTSSSGYGADFLLGIPDGSRDYTGRISHGTAHGQISSMNSHDAGDGYLGVNNWRLPHAAPVGGSEEYLEGELSYNYHMNLGGVDCFGDKAGCTNQTGLDNQSLFVNLSFDHWTDSGEFFQEDLGFFCPCAIVQVGASQRTIPSVQTFYHTWPVADGDFGTSAVPIPATAWLFGSALVGLLVARRW